MLKYSNLLAIPAIALAVSPVAAIPFDNSTGTTATVVVDSAGGAGVDYTSLKEASNAFNAVTLINRPWVLRINSDLAVTERVAFGTNVTPGASLTIKPAAGKTPTVTFTNTTPFAANSYFGALVIGANNDAISSSADPTPTSIFETNNAFIIDGSNTDGGVSRDLTLTCPSSGENTGYIIRVVGSTNGIVIKNTRIIHQRTGGGSNCIGFGAGKIVGFGTQGGDYKSDFAVVENCYLESRIASTATSGIGINYSNSAFGTLTANKNYEGHNIRNNVFWVRHRAVNALYQVNTSFIGNEVHVMNPVAAGGQSGGFHHVLQSGTFPTTYTITVANNRFLDQQSSNTAASQGMISVAMAGGTNANYKVYNNVMTGFLLSTATPTDFYCQGIQCASPSSTYDVQHNSINIAPQAGVSGATIGRAAGIYLVNGAGATSSTIANNIVRYAVGKGAPFVTVSTGATHVPIAPSNVTGNDFVQVVTGDPLSPLAYIGAAATPVANATPYADQAALSGAGYNLGGGQSVDPAATTPPWAADLSFASAPAGLGTVASSSILTDINGEARPATNAYPGAYRIVSNSAVNDWSVY